MLEEAIQKILLLVDLWAVPGKLEAPCPLPCSWSIHSTHCCHSWSCFKEAVLREQCAIETIWTVDVTEPHLRPLYKLLNSSGWVPRSAISCLSKTSLMYKFPCLLKQPPTNLEGPASFSSLSSSSVYVGPVTNCTQGTPEVCKPTG